MEDLSKLSETNNLLNLSAEENAAATARKTADCRMLNKDWTGTAAPSPACAWGTFMGKVLENQTHKSALFPRVREACGAW
jgi:hypothetical protein